VDRNDKMCEQPSQEVFPTISPIKHVKQVREHPEKERRVRHFTAVAVLSFVLMMALWARLSQARVRDTLIADPAFRACVLVRVRRRLLPPRRLPVNRREVKQVYHTYKPKKRDFPPPAPFGPHEHILDCVQPVV
jgi:hypothetical protein